MNLGQSEERPEQAEEEQMSIKVVTMSPTARKLEFDEH